MSMRTLEAAILKAARETFKNSKLRQKDILAWSTGEEKPANVSEVAVWIPNPGVTVVIACVHDKRGGKK